MNHSIARSCRAHNNHKENLRDITFRQLMSYSSKQLEALACSDVYTKIIIRRVQRHAMDFKFWANALDNTRTVFSLSKGHHFVITPQLISTLPSSEAKDHVQSLDFERTDDAPWEMRSLFEMLADDEVPCGPFSLPMLDLDHRREVLNDLAWYIERRHLGEGRGNGGSARVLVGPKGTGKSAFLQAFAIVAALLCPKMTVIYISYTDVENDPPMPISPARMIYYADLCARGSTALAELPLLPPADDWQSSRTLGASNQQFLIIGDDFDKVYSAEDRSHIVSQFRSIGQSTTSRVSVILSGSSAELINLCCGGVVGAATRIKYPSYPGGSLNSRCYCDLHMQPASGRDQFRSMLQRAILAAEWGHEEHRFFSISERDLQRANAALADDRHLAQIYRLTGGRFCYLKEFFEGEETSEGGSVSSLEARIEREFSDQWSDDPDFKAVMEMLVEKKEKNAIRMAMPGTDGAGVPAADALWTETWLYSDELDNAGISKSWVCELGDKNLLFVESSKVGMKVTFAVGIQEDLCRARRGAVKSS